MLNTPVLFALFNRLDTTQKVFTAIRAAQPKQLFIAADGPRAHKEGEAAKCEEVRTWVLSQIDWPCEVSTLFRDNNLGSGPAVSGAINWFFSKVDRGIILEDDCLPENSFFEYADAVLERYADDERIMHVSGFNFQCGKKRGNASYYFSHIPATWGWATWKRAWDKYSFDFFQDSEQDIREVLERRFPLKADVDFYAREMASTRKGTFSAWDYQWFYTLVKYNALCVTPQYNLITNLGFNSGGTHTFEAPYWLEYLVNKPVTPLKFPQKIVVDEAADSFYLALTMGRRNDIRVLPYRIYFRLKRMLK